MAVHHTSKSKALITNMNRLGQSISHSTVERFQVGLASFTARSGELRTPLPSHFDPCAFTTAAFDNFDHESYSLSGMKGTHDTVSVLFQQKNASVTPKPNISDNNDHSNRSFTKLLKCQEKKEFLKLPKNINLPDSYTASTTGKIIEPEEYQKTFESADFAWYLSRMDIGKQIDNSSLVHDENQCIPSWSAFHSLLQEDNRPCDQVGFLPVLPHPVTSADTVYTLQCVTSLK